MKLTSADLDRLEHYGAGGFTTYEEQMALIEMARQRDEFFEVIVLFYDLLEDGSYCTICDRHAPKDVFGRLAGDVPHMADCPMAMAESIIARATGTGDTPAREGER